jgi:Ca-activated chloride channel family protein
VIALLACALQALDGPRSAAAMRWSFGELGFADPLFLLGVPVSLCILAFGRARRGRAVGRVSLLPFEPLRSLRQRLAFLPTTLSAVALALAFIALARPLRGNVVEDRTSEGVDLLLVVDRSGSMGHMDMQSGLTRLDVVKDVVLDFARRRMSDVEGASDYVGLISFARYPRVVCPFTLDADGLTGFLEGVEIVEDQAEDGTAIGVGLAKAVQLLAESTAKSKVVVLLTDGENNGTEIAPLEAARLAAEKQIRVHTVFAAKHEMVHDPFRGGWVPSGREPDTRELEEIARLTGGSFFRARDRAGLEATYAEIERMERTPRTSRRFEEARDLYLYPLLLCVGFYAAAWLSSSTWARRVA